MPVFNGIATLSFSLNFLYTVLASDFNLINRSKTDRLYLFAKHRSVS